MIEEVSNDDSPIPTPFFSFVPFTEFHKHMDYFALVGENWNINLLIKKMNCNINSHTSYSLILTNNDMTFIYF